MSHRARVRAEGRGSPPPTEYDAPVGAPDPVDLRGWLAALATLGCEVGVLEAMVARAVASRAAGGDDADETLREVETAIGHAVAGGRLGLAGGQATDGAGGPAGPSLEEVTAIARREAEASLARARAGWQEDLVGRTVAEVASRTGRAIADLAQSGAFLEKVTPAILSKAEDTARRSVAELAGSLRQQLKDEVSRTKRLTKDGAKTPGPGLQDVVDEVLKRLHEAGLLDPKPDAAAPALTPAQILDSREFKEVLEDRLHHIVNFVKNEVVPDEVRKLLKLG